jgi:hypothetical protein
MVFTVLLVSSFQQCIILSFHVQWFLFSLAGTFQLQLISYLMAGGLPPVSSSWHQAP